MKRFGLLLALILAVTPAWAAKKVTVQQLKDMLVSLQNASKSDTDVANELKQVELTEEMTMKTKIDLLGLFPQPYTQFAEQIYALEAKSATLPPPATDLPATPPPDAAAQTALLNKAFDYASKTYSGQQHLTATKTTLRFQDNLEALAASSGMHSGGQDASLASIRSSTANQFVRYINSTETKVELENGAEKPSTEKDKTPWGQNGYIALQEPDPSLGQVISEARGAGNITFLRWETVNGKAAAVFAYTVDKKKSHMAVNVCCFPDTEQAGRLNYSQPTQGNMNPAAHGNLQTSTSWHNYKAQVPYHGEFFVDPDTGIIVRLIVMDDFKKSDVVHQQDERIDYGPVQVGSQTAVLPLRTIIASESVPNGDSGAGGYSVRHCYFTAEYKGYAAQ
ncbi:MAG: hypothetical protein WCE75_15940 [Terracidiphilus sp.]